MELNSETKPMLWFILAECKLLLFLLTIIFSLYLYYAHEYDFFEKKGVKFMKPLPIVGNLSVRIFQRISFHQYNYDVYNFFKGSRCGGVFEGWRRPILHVIDIDLIKAVTTSDFDHFLKRDLLESNEPKYLSQSPLHLTGSKWRTVRSILTPAFSPSRLKNMFPLIEECSQQMITFLKKYDGKDVELKDSMGNYTMEVICACAFGIKFNALTGENADFMKFAKRLGKTTKLSRVLLFLTLVVAPMMGKYLNISVVNSESANEIVKILKVAKKERRSGDQRRHDILQLLVDAAQNEKVLDDDTIDAQCLFFLIVGYEMSSTLLAFAAHVLATKPELQEKLRTHVQEITEGKEMSHEVLSQLTYLEAFILETLRLYPPVARVSRMCTKKYTLPGTSVQLDVGDVVTIPIYGIQTDPDIYPNPEEFVPERFLGEENKSRFSNFFLAFGAGPRTCIGQRFVMYTAKMSMISILKNFKLSVCPKTEDPVKLDKHGFLLKAENGIWVRIDSL